MVAIAVCLAGCKETEKTVIVKPETLSVSGTLKDYYSVVDGKYKIEESTEFTDCFIISVELERTSEKLPFGEIPIEVYGSAMYDVEQYYQVGFGIALLDENGKVLAEAKATGTGSNDLYDYNDVTDLAELPENERGRIRWTFYDEDEIKNAKKFRISSISKLSSGESYEEDDSDNYDSSDDYDSDDIEETPMPTTKASNTDWDKILDDYEKVMDKYLAAAKKAQAGDLSVMADVTSLMGDVQKLSDKLQNASAELTTNQAARLSKIAAKLAGEAASMY